MKNFSKKIAVVGFGYWGQKLAAVSKAVGLEVVIVDTGVVQKGSYFQKTWSEVLADSSITGVIVSTPEKTHAELVTAALEAQKAVLVEKPATTSAVAWKNCVNLAHKNKISLMVDYTFLHSQAFHYWLQLTQQYARLLGKLRVLKTTRKTEVSSIRVTGKGLPIWWDVIIHDLYLCRAAFGILPTHWQVTFVQLPSELTAIATLGEARFQAHYSWTAAPERSWLAEYEGGTLLWERVNQGEHFVLSLSGKVLVDEVIADQNPSPLETVINQWLKSWQTPNNSEQQQLQQEALHDVEVLEKLDSIFMAQVATRSQYPDQK